MKVLIKLDKIDNIDIIKDVCEELNGELISSYSCDEKLFLEFLFKTKKDKCEFEELIKYLI